MLHGRAAELADIHGLLADARGSRSFLLVVQGEMLYQMRLFARYVLPAFPAKSTVLEVK